MSLSFEPALLPTILEIAPSPVVILDRDARIRLFNKAAEAATGYAKTDVLGQPFWKLLEPNDESRIRELFTELRVGKRDTVEGIELGRVSRTSGKKHLPLHPAAPVVAPRDAVSRGVCLPGGTPHGR